jgi:hypothetical protein
MSRILACAALFIMLWTTVVNMGSEGLLTDEGLIALGIGAILIVCLLLYRDERMKP